MSPFQFVEVEKDWGNRHMFRAPYSLNEKTWMVSLPLKRIDDFDIEKARPENMLPNPGEMFIRGEENEAELLLIDAMDWAARQKKEEKPKKKKAYTGYSRKVDEEFFPPCMKLALAGLGDGRKRSVFTIVNFLREMKWSWEEINEKITEWNSKNKPPLPNTTVLATVRYHERRNPVTPPNCFNDQFYVSIGICQPDDRCKRIKNPVNYPFTMMKKPVQQEKKENLYKCGICNEAFQSPKSLEIHKGRVH